MPKRIKQITGKNSHGITEYARQLERQINLSGDLVPPGYSQLSAMQKSIAIYHFSNATRSVLLPLATRKKEENLSIIHDLFPRSSLVKPLNPFFMRFISKRSKHLVVHTEAAKDLLLKGYPTIPPDQVTVIPHGTFIHDVLPEEKEKLRNQYGFKIEDKILFILGAITRKRGQAKFLEAFAKTGAANLGLIISGKCSDPSAGKIIRGTPSIRYFGFAPNREVRDFYKMCDAVVVFREGTVGESSSTIAYGLGFGKPVLISDNGPFREMVGEGGLPFENRIKSISRMLEQIATDKIDLAHLGKMAKAQREKYRWDIYLDKILALLDR